MTNTFSSTIVLYFIDPMQDRMATKGGGITLKLLLEEYKLKSLYYSV